VHLVFLYYTEQIFSLYRRRLLPTKQLLVLNESVLLKELFQILWQCFVCNNAAYI